jgi:hypothetical protein
VFRIKYLGILLLASIPLGAVPIKPDLQKILKQEQLPRKFEPAHAGWNGPELVRPQDAAPNPIYEAYGPASTARIVRASLAAAVVPDPKAIAAIFVVILLMRYLRQRWTRKGARNVTTMPIAQVSSEVRRAA